MSLILSGTDGLSDVDGTVSTPAIRGTDANTGIFFPAADTIAFTEGGVESMRIDSSGNVGIGTSSPATRLHVAGATTATSQLTTQHTGSAVTTVFGCDGGIDAGAVYVTTNHPLAFKTNNTERMRITAAGDVGIGMNSPQRKLVVHTGAIDNGIQITNDTSGSTAGSGFELIHYPGGEAYLINRRNSVMAFFTNNTERMRIDSSGALLVGTTSFAVGTNGTFIGSNGRLLTNCNDDWNQELSGSQTGRIRFFSSNGSGTQVGTITVNTTNTAYNTSSDYRLKEDIAPMTGALAKVQALKPVTYKWKADGSAGQGFIAHELKEVVPDAVAGEKDAVTEDGTIKPQGVDYGKITPLLTAALQEALAKIESLEARLAVLESK